jgi:hypothetical protein
MRLSIMAGWFYSVARTVRGEAESHTTWHANRGVARDLDCAELNSQTLAPACRYSQNVVKMPVDAGVLISPRGNIISRALQNASQNFARFIANKNPVARKEQRVFRGEGVVGGNEPGIRCAPSGLRLLSAQRMLAFLLALMFAFSFSLKAEALEIKKEAVLLYGGIGKSFLTAQEALDDVKAWLESQKAEGIAKVGYYYESVVSQRFS